MYSRILVPLDGSALAEAALPRAEALAHLAPSTLYLLRAAPPEEEGTAASYLETVADHLRARGLVVETLTVPGDPTEAIVWEAAHRDVDVVVMATHGRGGVGRGLLGSVADQVLHRMALPVLLVRADQPALVGRPRRVLVPLDGSELAEQALVHARAAVGTQGEILLYQAVAPATPIVEPMTRDSAWAEMWENTQADALRYLEEVATPLRAAGYRVRTAAEHGVPAERIARYARQEQVDLIVVSSHGRSGAARWLLGSVADDLLRHAPAPLLLLRPLLAMAQRPLAEARLGASALSTTPLPPPTTLRLSGEQVRLVRLALESLLWDVTREERLAAEIQALLDQLPLAQRAEHGEGQEKKANGSAGGPLPVMVGAAEVVMDQMTAIPSGYPVFAQGVGPENRPRVGPFVGVVQDTFGYHGTPYVHLRSGLENADALFLPLAAVRAVGGHQVHLNLTAADLVGETWHVPPWAALGAA